MSRKQRWAEMRAALGWIARSWLRPAGAEATWEQPGHAPSDREGGPRHGPTQVGESAVPHSSAAGNR